MHWVNGLGNKLAKRVGFYGAWIGEVQQKMMFHNSYVYCHTISPKELISYKALSFRYECNWLRLTIVQGYSDKIAGSMIVRDILQRKYSHFFATSIYTPATIPGRFIGMSLGSILGGGWVAYSQIHDRAVLLAGGSSFSFLIGRSDLFWALMLLCDFQFYSRTDLRLALQLAQSSIDSLESTGWTHTGRLLCGE